MSRFKDVYIGKIIRAKVDEKGIGYAEFARRINCARTSLYHIFNSKSIDVERLLLISEVLDFDFIGEVYLGRETPTYSSTFLQIPFRNGSVDLSHLPKELFELLKKEVS